MEENSNTIPKPDNDNNNCLYSDLIYDRYILSNNDCSYIPTRVFDVYSAKDFSKDNMPYLDVFAKEFHPKELIKQELIDKKHNLLNFEPNYTTPKSANSDTVPLNKVAIEIPSRSNNDETIFVPMTNENLKNEGKKSLSIDSQPSSSLSSIYPTADTKDLDTSSTNIMKYTTADSHITKDSTDKWPSEVEDAFVASLKLIPKKGTSKIKVLHKNYGRNELISLYIYYYTRSFRSKKQISSHIQVLKKAITSKKDNNLSITNLELELYNLIENGAPKNEKTKENFEKQFTVIVEELEEEVLRDPKHLLCESFPMLNPFSKKKSHLLNGKHDKQNRMITPCSTRNNMNPAFDFDGDQELLENNQKLMYPAKYARDMYGNLSEYKCLPINIEDDNVYCPYPTNNNNNNNEKNANIISEDNTFGTKSMTRDAALKEALKVEKKQRRIIDMVSKSLQAKQNIEENDNIIELNINSFNNNSKNSSKSSISQKITNTTTTTNCNNSYNNDLASGNNNVNVFGISSNYPSYYSHSPVQWNTVAQPLTAPTNPQNNKIEANNDDLSEQSQLLTQTDLELLPNQSQLYSMVQKNRLYPSITPLDSHFLSNYPQLQWFSPNNHWTMSQYNFGLPQYTQNSDFVDYKSTNQSVMGQPSDNQQPHSQYQLPYFMSGGPPNSSPTYPTFNSQNVNKPFR